MGTIMDFAGKHSFCKTTYNRPKTWIKLLILIPFFTSAFTFYFLNKEHGLTHNFEVNPDFLPLNMDMHYKIVWMCDIFFAILIAVFLDKRWGCRHLCMMGTLTSIGAKYSRLLVVVDTNECTNCGRCEKECLSAIPLLNYIKDNKGLIANPECLLCGKCLQTCKSNAISLKFIWNRSKYKQENKASSNSFIHGS
jgi:polyferredoxin